MFAMVGSSSFGFYNEINLGIGNLKFYKMIIAVMLVAIGYIALIYHNHIQSAEIRLLKEQNLRFKNDIDTYLKILNGDSVRAKPKRSGN
jgi:hypothetical protein